MFSVGLGEREKTKMKKTFLSLLLLVVAATMSAQSLLLGDTDQNGRLEIADVTKSVNMILGREAQGSIALNPYIVDNSLVAGTWYVSDGTSFTLEPDGTTTYPGGATYKFMPYQGLLMVYKANGNPLRALPLCEVSSESLLVVNYATGTFTRYLSSGPFVLVTSISLSETNLALELDAYKKLGATILPDNATNTNVVWSSSNENVATVSSSGMVEATGIGSCTITCAATDGSGVSATCTVNVDLHECVDLGLPSRTLWATYNIGADKPEDYGDYFAWGETTGYKNGKTNFDWSTYKWCKGSNTTLTKYCNDSCYGNNGFMDTLTELEPEDDAAYVNWGSGWRMPSLEQLSELINSSYTTTTWTTQNGIYGRKITSTINGNSLFLPAAGYRDDWSLYCPGSGGFYWLRTLEPGYPPCARILYFTSEGIFTTSPFDRYYGHCVRPVRLSQ